MLFRCSMRGEESGLWSMTGEETAYSDLFGFKYRNRRRETEEEMDQGMLKEEEIAELLSGIENVRLNEEESAVVIVDQTALPGKKEFLELGDAKALYDAIFELKVRGAPAIGICAAYGIFILAKRIQADSGEAFYKKFKEMQRI